MDPQELLAGLCRRHGLDPQEQADLLPLAERAVLGPPEDREKLMVLLGEALRLRSDRSRRPRTAGRTLDEGLLLAVARALHGWATSERGDGPTKYARDDPRD
jgi:hypothetical protein